MTNATMLFDENNINAGVGYLTELMHQSKTVGLDLKQEIMDAAINKFREEYGDGCSTPGEINKEGKLVYLGIWKGLFCSFVVCSDGKSTLKQEFTLDSDPEGWNKAACSLYIYAV